MQNLSYLFGFFLCSNQFFNESVWGNHILQLSFINARCSFILFFDMSNMYFLQFGKAKHVYHIRPESHLWTSWL